MAIRKRNSPSATLWDPPLTHGVFYQIMMRSNRQKVVFEICEIKLNEFTNFLRAR